MHLPQCETEGDGAFSAPAAMCAPIYRPRPSQAASKNSTAKPKPNHAARSLAGPDTARTHEVTARSRKPHPQTPREVLPEPEAPPTSKATPQHASGKSAMLDKPAENPGETGRTTEKRAGVIQKQTPQGEGIQLPKQKQPATDRVHTPSAATQCAHTTSRVRSRKFPPTSAAKKRRSVEPPRATQRRSTPAGGNAMLDKIAESEEETGRTTEKRSGVTKKQTPQGEGIQLPKHQQTTSGRVPPPISQAPRQNLNQPTTARPRGTQ